MNEPFQYNLITRMVVPLIEQHSMLLAALSAHVGDAKSKTICETVFPEAITRSDHLSRILVSFLERLTEFFL